MPVRAAFACAAVLAVASAHAADPTPAAVEHFEKAVRPLLLDHCGKCHGLDPKKVKGGLTLTTRAGLFAGGEAGPAVVPGKPDESPLVQSVRYDGDLKMPPKGRLRDHEVAALEKWVKDGAVWPGDAPPRKDTDAGKGPLFTAEQKNFWAFQPVQDPPPPTAKNAAWATNPVDAFVLARLEAAGLTPAPPADPRTLLRRVTFDLTGLPPTPEDIEAFVADRSPNAFAKVVDRLLASPHYGERWGRHWLDVARYADSNGLDENTAFANAWRYRDYVVAAFNADKPFDRFVTEQIAGDLLPPSDDPKVQAERFTALGYLVVGAKLLAEPDKQKMMLDIADEQLDTLGKGLTGLTLGCARCHDHKFDPVPTRDYYSLLAVFTSTRTMQNLNTVAKAFERPLNGPETKDQTDARKRLETLRKEVRQIEKEFGGTPEKDKAKRQELHEKAEVRRAEIKKLEAAVKPVEAVLSVEEGTAAAYGTRPRNLHVQVRGNYVTPGEEAPAVFPRIISGETQTPFVKESPNADDKPAPAKVRYGAARDRSGRLELANWLTDPKHPLTARVFVNRVWQHHFGHGIVRSPDNFGQLGDRPTHPELLDWLASRFVADGWSVKALHRRIVLSNTYQMASSIPQSELRIPHSKDPDNRLLWRYPRRRLEAEAIRDAMLAAAGTLDRTVGGTLFPHGNFEYVGGVKYDTARRTLYLPVIRNNVFPFLQTFDFPDPSTMNGKRDVTVVAPQALYLMNSPFVAQQAAAFADRAAADAGPAPDARVRRVYRLALGRDATTEEVAAAVGFVASFREALAATEPDAGRRDRRAWAGLCQAVFAGSEFATLE